MKSHVDWNGEAEAPAIPGYVVRHTERPIGLRQDERHLPAFLLHRWPRCACMAAAEALFAEYCKVGGLVERVRHGLNNPLYAFRWPLSPWWP